MNKKSKIITTIFIFLFLFSAKIWSQKYDIHYYGIVSKDLDLNMAKMTSDLYFTQLSEINNFSVEDKREAPLLEKQPDVELFSEDSLAFFASISKNNSDESWSVTFHVIDKKNDEEHIKKKNYASFYKILMESKNELKETIKQLIENDKGNSIQISAQLFQENNQNNKKQNSKTNITNVEENQQKPHKTISLENLSGTWKGEDNIDKIVILRGGRGFVIFKNGASMNILIKNSTSTPNQIIVTQNSKSNASFFPELPRNIALQAAVNAEPIQWILDINDENNLKGIKQTLLPDGDSCTKGEIPVEWNKK